MNGWRRWVEQPQGLWLRRALFQVHVWTGIGAGLYILVVSVTGSLLVYRNELYRAVTPAPTLVSGTGPRLSPEAFQEAVSRAYPGYSATVYAQRNPDRAVDVRLTRGTENKFRLFDPFTGNDLGDSIPPGVRIVSWLTDLHDNLLFGPTGRRINGIGALLWTGLAATGLVIWWPGRARWRRAFLVDTRHGWKRVNWDLHSAVGIWMLAPLAMWAVTGLAFSFPAPFRATVNWASPLTVARAPQSDTHGKPMGERPSWRALIEEARRHVPDEFVARVVVPGNDRGAFLVSFSPVSPTLLGADLKAVYLDQLTGERQRSLLDRERLAQTLADRQHARRQIRAPAFQRFDLRRQRRNICVARSTLGPGERGARRLRLKASHRDPGDGHLARGLQGGR